MKLHVGCGYKYKDGFINIDGNADLPRVDKVIKLPDASLLDHYSAESVDLIICHDFIEHLFHWQAINVMAQFYILLVKNGKLELKLPNFDTIINSGRSSQEKITLLFGGQDIYQGEPDATMRQKYPEFHCHKYAYTINTMSKELKSIGFHNITSAHEGTNFIIHCNK